MTAIGNHPLIGGWRIVRDFSGAKEAELHDDRSLQIEFAYHLGNEPVPQGAAPAFFNSLLGHASGSQE
jgi:hypothetical protein